MYNDKNCHSTVFGLYGWLLADQPNDACMFAFGASSSEGVLRWNLEMVAAG